MSTNEEVMEFAEDQIQRITNECQEKIQKLTAVCEDQLNEQGREIIRLSLSSAFWQFMTGFMGLMCLIIGKVV